MTRRHTTSILALSLFAASVAAGCGGRVPGAPAGTSTTSKGAKLSIEQARYSFCLINNSPEAFRNAFRQIDTQVAFSSTRATRATLRSVRLIEVSSGMNVIEPHSGNACDLGDKVSKVGGRYGFDIEAGKPLVASLACGGTLLGKHPVSGDFDVELELVFEIDGEAHTVSKTLRARSMPPVPSPSGSGAVCAR